MIIRKMVELKYLSRYDSRIDLTSELRYFHTYSYTALLFSLP